MERITGIDVVNHLLVHAHHTNKKILVLGGRMYGGEDVSSTMPTLKKLQLSSLTQAFWMEGYADIAHPAENEEAVIAQTLKKLQPAYVFVAFGAPHQERWLIEHSDQLGMAVGGSFDVLTGQLKRAPSLFQQLHLEWLFRLFQEPWRWRRQTKLLLFFKEAVREFLK